MSRMSGLEHQRPRGAACLRATEELQAHQLDQPQALERGVARTRAERQRTLPVPSAAATDPTAIAAGIRNTNPTPNRKERLAGLEQLLFSYGAGVSLPERGGVYAPC